jgi:acyl-[acyl-carrier-protein]-phospholipid O-acyltransferase/long-chain-fatty-acid--[acyl-carrier-protein] ligase
VIMRTTEYPNLRMQRLLLPFVKLVSRMFLKYTSHGAANVPGRGAAILVSNHASFIDAVLIMAAMRRPVLVLMDRQELGRSSLWWLLSLLGVVGVDYHRARGLVTAGSLARRALAAEVPVVVFPEIKVSRTGFLNEFTDLQVMLGQQDGCPVIPVYIDITTSGGRTARGTAGVHPSVGIRKKVGVVFGAPGFEGLDAFGVRQKVQALSVTAYELRKTRRRSIGYCFVRQARRQWRRAALADTTGKRLSFGETLITSLVLAQKVKAAAASDSMIGVLLPATAGAALINCGITLAGKIPVNLNFTSSAENISHAVELCRIKRVITSRQFVARFDGLTIPAETLFLEDLAAAVKPLEKIVAFVKAICVPARILTREKSSPADDCATVVFSSGSTSHPKGIVLTHHNIISNIEQMCSVLDLDRDECMVAALPFFHSFGLTATLWYPLLAGFRVAYHPNPLDCAIISSLVGTERGTILLATPTFLQTYLRKARREELASLRLVISGAEKLKPALARAFQESFGITLLEGYGATELSPVACLNVPDIARWGICERGNRLGSIGRLLPGMACRLVDPETGRVLGQGETGLLQVKGPNVMKEYLHDPEMTIQALSQGWYSTGDIASIGVDGFVTLTDRLSRFSKIGGEMVPHGVIENILIEAIPAAEAAIAVTSVADPQRGEKLVVLYTEETGGAESLRKVIDGANIPNLWKPDRDAFVQVEKIPVLGTGKTDLKGVKTLAAAAFVKS